LLLEQKGFPKSRKARSRDDALALSDLKRKKKNEICLQVMKSENKSLVFTTVKEVMVDYRNYSSVAQDL